MAAAAGSFVASLPAPLFLNDKMGRGHGQRGWRQPGGGGCRVYAICVEKIALQETAFPPSTTNTKPEGNPSPPVLIPTDLDASTNVLMPRRRRIKVRAPRTLDAHVEEADGDFVEQADGIIYYLICLS